MGRGEGRRQGREQRQGRVTKLSGDKWKGGYRDERRKYIFHRIPKSRTRNKMPIIISIDLENFDVSVNIL